MIYEEDGVQYVIHDLFFHDRLGTIMQAQQPDGTRVLLRRRIEPVLLVTLARIYHVPIPEELKPYDDQA